MDQLQIIMAMIGGLAALMLALFKMTCNRFDRLEEKVTDIDRRLCRLEGAFSQQQGCALRDHRRADSE